MTVDAMLRCRRVSSAALIAVTMAFAAGCSSNKGGSSSSGSTTGSHTTGTTATASSTGSTGTHGTSSSGSTGSVGGSTGSSSGSGSGSTGGTIGSGLVANDPATFGSPFDAVPAPATGRVYFTGISPSSGYGQVFFVTPPATAVSTVANAGASATQFIAPLGLALSSDGATAYVADPSADNGTDDRGCILKLATAGGSAGCVSGTERYAPTAVAIGNTGSGDTLYFVGTDPSSGARNAFQLPAAGGSVAALGGSGFGNPTGIVADNAGNAYVIDSSGGFASVTALSTGSAQVLARGLRPGVPSGIGINATGTKLYVATLDPVANKDAVATIDVVTKAVTYSANNGINTLGEPAGLKQAGTATAYVDSTANSGSVFLVTP